ncbi:MAG: Lrp/AsnC family transcriptional regulator [Burkholderiales bacterium]|nr:Lrp/AsnC family transcriptional regulator [Burkholderiales bacterium]MDE2297199.1 Lrp/AsnC family transcriptional regulator [Burkholderiales bacterium]MDE2627314.1 Lrp/AsnC family transcriptional regulator [Burkholderiales bacterium]
MQSPPIDRADRRLLLELSQRGRAANVDLAQAVHLSASAVARRQRALEEAGVIRGYSADIDPAAFGLNTTVVVQVTLKGQSEADLGEFEQAVAQCDSVLRCFLMSGSDDYLLILLVRDLIDFERVHKTQLSRLPHVARIQSSFALRDVVRRALPADLLRD